MPGRSGVTVVTCSCALLFCTRGCGRNGRPAFPAPSRAEGSCKTRAPAARSRRHVPQISLTFSVNQPMPRASPERMGDILAVLLAPGELYAPCEPCTISLQQIVGADMNFPLLFSPLQLGPYRLSHRVVMAPLTRMRAEKHSLAPRPLNTEYYAQRATSGGLIIAEASPVTTTGHGNSGTPGIYSEAQIKGWRAVVDAVHAKGGLIFLQLW